MEILSSSQLWSRIIGEYAQVVLSVDIDKYLLVRNSQMVN